MLTEVGVWNFLAGTLAPLTGVPGTPVTHFRVLEASSACGERHRNGG
jgi:hypothetical protein